jgi:thiol-disulfide isomerase/thioredoxin
MNNKLTNFLSKTYKDRFKRYLILSLIILGAVLISISQQTAKPSTNEGLEVDFFYLPGCSHCEAQEQFNEKLANAYPSIHFVYHDATKPQESALLSAMLAELGVDEESYPITIFGERVFQSWDSEETTGKQIEEALQECLAGNCQAPGSPEPKGEITLPFIGKIRLSDYSLPGLAVILGLVDGFNPCAMWVLVYLISIVATLKDKRRIWLICGSFVLASGILYFVFMAAWLKAFLLIGYFRPVTIVIGLVALGGGILQVREFIETKGAIVCEVTGEESRKNTMAKVQKIVSAPLTWGILAGIIALAFTVNAVEFVCSAAIPAVFTQILSLSHLPTLQYYGYILLYDFFFMLDDLIIFGTATFALTSNLADRYAKYTRPVGGTILIILGALLLFAPNLLR